MDKLLNLLGICKKAGKLKHGYDACVESMKNQKACLIIIASDTSEKTVKNIIFEAEKHDAKYIKISRVIEEISFAIGKKCAVISVEDIGFSKKMLELTSN